MQTDFVMFYDKDRSLEVLVISDEADQEYLICWCNEQFNIFNHQRGSHFYVNGRMFTPFRFACLEDVMGFKLRWEE